MWTSQQTAKGDAMNRSRQVSALATAIVAGLLWGQAACLASTVPGEIPDWLRAGAPVRLRIVGPGLSKTITGQYVRHDDSTLYIGTVPGDRTREIELGQIVRLEVSQERTSRAWGGFWLGYVAGAIAGSAAVVQDHSTKEAGAAILGLTFYGPLAGLVGSAVGGTIHKYRWVIIWDRSPERR